MTPTKTLYAVPVTDTVVVSTEVQQKVNAITLNSMQSLDNFGNDTAQILNNLSRDMSMENKLKSMGEIGDKIGNLLKTAKELDPSVLTEKPSFFGKLMGKIKDPIDSFVIKQKSVSQAVKDIANKLLEDRNTLLAENNKLEQIYNSNLSAFNKLEEYIIVGTQRLEELKQELSSFQGDESKYLELQTGQSFIDRFEQRLDRLNSSKAIVMRQLPQIRIMQSSNFREAETIQDCVNTAIPVWEQQINLYISQLRTKLALENERNVTKMINDTIKTSAELTHQNTVEIAQASTSSLIELDTIRTVQDNLLKSIDVMAQTAETGRQKRKESFLAIVDMDKQLKENLTKER